MATRKIEVDENDLKKVILMLKLSKQYVQIPNNKLTLYNMWRVSGKLADKLMRKSGLSMVTVKGRTFLKPIGEVDSEVANKDVLAEENPAEVKLEKVSEAQVEKPVEKVPRCRKRKK